MDLVISITGIMPIMIVISTMQHIGKSSFRNLKAHCSDGSGPKPGPGPAWSPGFLESPRLDIGRRAQDQVRPEPVVKSPGAQRALGI